MSTRDMENAQMAGQPVHFVCLDVSSSSSDDFEFDARCHFIPRVGECIEYKKLNMVVIRVFYRLVDCTPVDLGFCSSPTVVCHYSGETDEETVHEVKKLIQSLESFDTSSIENPPHH